MSPVMPAPDPVGLPAPAWLLQALLVLTFVLHLLPMKLALGGGFVAAWAAWHGRRGSHRPLRDTLPYRELASLLARMLTVATGFAITLGIAPLLFLQVVYGPLFYTSSILMAWGWLAVIALLLAGYYGYYGFAFAQEHAPARAAALAASSATAFLAVAFLFTNNMTLMLRPERWHALYAASEHGLHLNLDDPTLVPRFAHFVMASLALTGLALAVIGRAQERRGRETAAFTRGLGVRLFLGATALQMVSGVFFLAALPERVRGLFLGARGFDTALLWGSAALALVAMAVAGRRLAPAVGATSLTVAGMALVRHRVREAMLAPYFVAQAQEVRSQTGLFVLFVLLLLAGLGVVAWMLRALRRPGGSRGSARDAL